MENKNMIEITKEGKIIFSETATPEFIEEFKKMLNCVLEAIADHKANFVPMQVHPDVLEYFQYINWRETINTTTALYKPLRDVFFYRYPNTTVKSSNQLFSELRKIIHNNTKGEKDLKKVSNYIKII